MTALASLMRLINLVNRVIGNVFMWLAVANRRGLLLGGRGAICLHEYPFMGCRICYPWMNGVMFTAVAGYALYRNDHVRVDIFFRPASTRIKAWL